MSPVTPLKRAPWWFITLMVLLALPLFSLLYLVNHTPEGSIDRVLAWLFPLYAVLSAVCACICYPDRRELAWILAALLAASDVCMLLL